MKKKNSETVSVELPAEMADALAAAEIPWPKLAMMAAMMGHRKTFEAIRPVVETIIKTIKERGK